MHGDPWMELLDAARDALRHGEHEGDCDSDSPYEACDLHMLAARLRHDRLAAAVLRAESARENAPRSDPLGRVDRGALDDGRGVADVEL
jgi:hypothetical protein